MYLHIFTKFHLAVSIEVQFAIEYDFRWTLCFGHATFEGKHGAPEHGCVYLFYDNDGREMFEWNSIVVTANSFLHSAVVSLDFWDMFVSRGDMKMGVQVSKVATNWLKLIICEHDRDSKSSGDICANQGFEKFEYVAILHDI